MIGNDTIWFDGIIPRTVKADIDAPDFWTKHAFKIITINNGSATALCKSK
jgi:hypothetical protein